MLVIPAIDLKGGKCVRLRQGKMNEETVFSDNPMQVAEQWINDGTTRLHIIDLDGAATGKPVHAGLIADIVNKFPEVEIQVGGGIRDEDTVQSYLNSGVRYVILGTRAITQPHFVKDLCLEFPNHIIVGLDVRDNKVAIGGWSKLSHHDLVDLALHFEQDGVVSIIFTDIARDGMLSGVNVESTVELASHLHIPVIAAGGVSTIADIEALHAVAEEGIMGVVVGRALYEKTLDLKAAQQLVHKLKS